MIDYKYGSARGGGIPMSVEGLMMWDYVNNCINKNRHCPITPEGMQEATPI